MTFIIYYFFIYYLEVDSYFVTLFDLLQFRMGYLMVGRQTLHSACLIILKPNLYGL